MAYGGTNAFFTKGYVVDYTKKNIHVEQNTTLKHTIIDFVANYISHIMCYIFIVSILLIIVDQIINIPQQTFSFIFTTATTTILTFFLFFNFYYINNNTPTASKLQMLFETPYYFYKKTKTLEIELNNHKEIEIHLDGYWKYWLTFKGECIKHRKKLLYLEIPYNYNVKKIQFTQPTTGTIIFKYKAGKIKKIKLT